MKDAWDKDANSLPRRAVGTMEMIGKASAIRHAEIAELDKKINTLKEEILALEAAEKGKSPE
jgi:polyhydroxyalkanoate synthesis regulator phasin